MFFICYIFSPISPLLLLGEGLGVRFLKWYVFRIYFFFWIFNSWSFSCLRRQVFFFRLISRSFLLIRTTAATLWSKLYSISHDFCSVSFSAIFSIPTSGLDSTFQKNTAAFVKILLYYFCLSAKNHNVVVIH